MPDPIFLSGDAIPSYLKDVELMTAGMEWPASTGNVTITMEHLADAVRAVQDPHIQPPRIKLGHTSPINGDHPDHDPFAALGDAEPSFGVFGNLALANDGAVLTGDADRVLTWLAMSAPATYPNRSSEATWQIGVEDDGVAFDVQTAGGKRYSMVVTAVSLLGVYLPAISDLEDLSTLIVSGPDALNAKKAPAALAGGKTTPEATALSVSTDVIRQRFNFDWAMGENDTDLDTYWWWARDVRVDDDEVIADDDEGNLWSVPYSTDGEDTVTFGEPAKVRQTFVPVTAAKVASFSRPSKPSRKPAAVAATNSAAVEQPYEGESTMPVTDQVREFLVGRGIDPDTATEVQINAATVLMAEQPEAEAPEPEAEATEMPEAEAETPAAERVPVAASRQIPEGMSLIDSATLAELKAGANAGTQLAREKATETRDRILSAARDEGRFPPARFAHYTRLYDADPEGTTVLLTAAEDKGGLAKGAVPLAARAVVPDPEAGEFAADEPLPENVSLLTRDQRAEMRARRA
jgi:hypothetical protein